jgi:CubicO group peptidase (beta-lactamase class C family)
MSAIRSVLEAHALNPALPGFVALATRKGETVFAEAFGKRGLSDDTPLSMDAVFFIASMTKAVTGVAAMQLVEQGKIGLDDDLGAVLPELARLEVLEGFTADGAPILRPAAGPVTLRHLLTHTSGFGYDMWSADLVRYIQQTGTPGIGSGLKAALKLPLVFDPGTRWEYGIGIDWAGLVVEALSGKALDVYVRDHITGPLGMEDTAFFPTPQMMARKADLHGRGPDGALITFPLPINPEPEFWAGGGGLYSTAPDYMAFLQMLLNGGTGTNGAPILEAQTVALMGQNHIGDLRLNPQKTALPYLTNDFDGGLAMGLTPATGWGLTFAVNPDPGPHGRSAGSLAWAGLANTYYWADPASGVAGILMTQVLPFADPAVLALFKDFEQAVYAV